MRSILLVPLLLASGSALAQYPVSGNVSGTAGGFPTLAQAESILDQMRQQYPTLISPRAAIGTSTEGLPIWMVEVSDNPGVDEGEPEVLFSALLHAQEPLGLTATLYTLWYLLEQYGTNPEVTHLLDTRRLFVLPILNPDGYHYNTSGTYSNGGGGWIKNLALVNGQRYGVNLDHNFGYRWSNGGVSCGDPGLNCFRGFSAFSEPEAQAVRAFVNARRFRTSLTYHSFHLSAYRNEPGRVLYTPWGHTILAPPEAALLDRMGEAMVAENGYRDSSLGGADDYTDGTMSDWLFGATDEHPRIYAFDLVMGWEEQWTTAARARQLAEQNVRVGLEALWFAGADVVPLGFVVADDGPNANGHLDPGDEGTATVRVRNDGGATAEGVRFRLAAGGTGLLVDDAWSAPVTLAAGDSVTLTFPLGVATQRPLGFSDDLRLEVSYTPVVSRRRVLRDLLVGTPVVLHSWDGTSLAGWCTSFECPPPPELWSLTSDAHSPPSAFTDSQGLMRRGPPTYANSPTLAVTGPGPVYLSYWAKWQILAYNSLGTVFGRHPNGSLLRMPTRHSRPADPDRPVQSWFTPAPVFDAAQFVWARQISDITAYAGTPFKLEIFSHAHASFYNMLGDGLLLDDIEVLRVVNANGMPTGGADPQPVLAFSLDAPVPNPASGRVALSYTMEQAGPRRLTVYDMLGREVAVLADGPAEAGSHVAVWEARAAAGSYLARLEAGGRTAVRLVTLR